jgi:putative peptide maturation dehydrogenase
MQLRRPHYLVFEPRERPERSLHRLLAAGDGDPGVDWVALAPHLGAECVVDAGDLPVFQALAPGEADDDARLASRFGQARIDRLVAAGLLIGAHEAHRELRARDDRLAAGGWWGPAALAQVFGRWDGVDVAAIEREEGALTATRLVQRHGPPPPQALALGPAEDGLPLPTCARTAFDDLLAARTTCRNFDPAGTLALESLACILGRVFGAQGALELAPGATILKKHSPSGGALHPIEAFVLVQRVEGLAPGAYHYHCTRHALEPMAAMATAPARLAAGELVAGQAWFVDAPVHVLMAARFPRSHWKYRRHPKAWKVVQLDAGHLSQTLLLSATERGLGAFVTGAINDGHAERLFGLDGLDLAPIAVCGFGPRAAQRPVRELDPSRLVPP